MNNRRVMSMEYLRIIAMLMIVFLHVQGKTGWLNAFDPGNGNWFIRWGIQGLCIPAVNVYVLISGYFLIEKSFSLHKCVKLWLHVEFWSILCTFICRIIVPSSVSGVDIVRAIFPFSTCEYWFVTIYLGMYCLTPFLSKLLLTLNKREHFLLMIVMIFFCSFLPSFIPFGSDDGRGLNGISGTNIFWFITLFIIAAYIKKFCYQINGHVKIASFFVYLGSTALNIIMRYVFFITDKKIGILGSLSTYYFNYASILCLVASLGLFICFIPVNNCNNCNNSITDCVIIKISACTFGIYLIHETPAVRRLLWGFVTSMYDGFTQSNMYFIHILLIGMGIFISCCVFEYVQILLFSSLENKISLWIAKNIENLYEKITYKIKEN